MSQYVSRSVVILLLALSLLVGGCSEAAHWYSRTFFDTDCRPQSLTSDGRCTSPSQKGASNAQTAHP